MNTSRPYSQACENNKAFILEKLIPIVQPGDTVLEIGSGTGQHAIHFAGNLQGVTWQPAELREDQAVLLAGLEGHGLPNLLEPVVVDVRDTWPQGQYDGVFSANCLHIMSAPCVELFFEGVGTLVKPGGYLCVYGPFNYNGTFTSQSNADFEQWLKARDPLSGIRDFEWVNSLAENAGFSLVEDHAMPANNRFLHWKR